MVKNKTVPTEESVTDYLAAIEDEGRRADCDALISLMTGITRQPPKMWGSSIVGFGSYHYKYESGREGDMCLTGFSSRKAYIGVYLMASGVNQGALLEKLGKHKMGKACLNIKRLDEVDLKVLKQLIRESVAETRRRYR